MSVNKNYFRLRQSFGSLETAEKTLSLQAIDILQTSANCRGPGNDISPIRPVFHFYTPENARGYRNEALARNGLMAFEITYLHIILYYRSKIKTYSPR